MNKKILVFPLACLVTLSLASCSNVNPTDLFMEKALNEYKALRENLNIAENEDYYAWYFDSEVLKGAVFTSLDEYEYLGIINFQTMSFSETNDYFLDLPNYEISIDFDTGEINMPSEFENITQFIKDLPLVLVKNELNKEKTVIEKQVVYSKFNDNGVLSTSAISSNYDPTYFYLKDFKIEVDIEGLSESAFEDFNIDYTGKNTLILKRDLYIILEQTLKEQGIDESLPIDIDIPGALLNNYRRANNLSNDENVPSTLVFPAKFNNLEVVVGPLALFDTIFDSLYDDETLVSAANEIQNVFFEEGITELSIFAFNGNKNITSIELPSTIKKLSLSSLSNLTNLEYLYIPQTTERINIFNTYGATISFQNPLSDNPDDKIEIFGPLQNSSIKKSLTFQDYDNINIPNFPFYDLVFNENETISDVVNYVIDKDTTKINSISEGFNTKKLNSINPLFMMDIPDNKVIENDTNLSLIDTNKTLYLAHNKARINNDLFFTDFNNFKETSGVSKEGSLTLTLKLACDLTVKGNLIIGGILGKNGTVEGFNVGNYASLDLNGHNLIIEGNGLVDVNGTIVDSSENQTGSIILNDNGSLKTSLVIHDSFGYSNYLNKYNNGDFPYNHFNFNNLKVSQIVFNGQSKLYAKEILVESESNVVTNEFVFYGQGGVYQPASETTCLIGNLGDSTKMVINGDISYNVTPFVFNSTKVVANSSKIFAPISSKFLSIEINEGNLNLNTKTKIINGGSLTINQTASLTLNSDLIIYPTNTEEQIQDNYLTLPAKEGKLNLYGNLIVNNKVALGGSITTNTLTIELLNAVNDSQVTPFTSNNEGSFVNNDYLILDTIESNLYIKNGAGETLYYRFNNGYYYSYTSNGISIFNTSTNNELASKENNSTWNIYVDGETLVTDNENDFISSFEDTLNSYTLSDSGKWNKVSNADENHIYYDDNNNQYIDVNSNLVQGTLIDSENLIFLTSSSNKYYMYNNATSSWRYVHLFEHNYVFAFPKEDSLSPNVSYNSKNYSSVYLINNNNYELVSTYDSAKHLIKVNNDQTTFVVYQNSKINNSYGLSQVEVTSSRMIAKDNEETNYIYLTLEKVWVKLYSLENNYYAISRRDSDEFVYTSNNYWERCNYYNNEYTEGYTFFELVDSYDIKRNFAMYDEGTNLATIITKMGGLELTAEDLENVGITDILPSGSSKYVGYRYFIKNGKICIFVQNEEGIASIKELASAPILEDFNSDVDGELTLRKVISLVQITIDGKYYYVNFEKVIASGSQESLENQSYLALAIYTTEVPNFSEYFKS